jgi:hypothetical protein
MLVLALATLIVPSAARARKYSLYVGIGSESCSEFADDYRNNRQAAGRNQVVARL